MSVLKSEDPKVRKMFEKAFDTFADPKSDLSHVANARKSNTAKVYDGAEMVERAAHSSDAFFDSYQGAISIMRGERKKTTRKKAAK